MGCSHPLPLRLVGNKAEVPSDRKSRLYSSARQRHG